MNDQTAESNTAQRERSTHTDAAEIATLADLEKSCLGDAIMDHACRNTLCSSGVNHRFATYAAGNNSTPPIGITTKR